MNEVCDQFGTSVMGLARRWRAEVDRRLKPLGISEARWLALHHLSRNDGALTQGNLAERLGIRGPTLVGQLDALEADGWVRRESAPNDRRSKVVRLTDEAMPLVGQIEHVIFAVRRELFSGIDDESLTQCLEVIRKLRARVDTLAADELEAPEPGFEPPGKKPELAS